MFGTSTINQHILDKADGLRPPNCLNNQKKSVNRSKNNLNTSHHDGVPEIVVVDQGGECASTFARECEEFEIDVRITGNDAGWQQGLIERYGGLQGELISESYTAGAAEILGSVAEVEGKNSVLGGEQREYFGLKENESVLEEEEKVEPDAALRLLELEQQRALKRLVGLTTSLKGSQPVMKRKQLVSLPTLHRSKTLCHLSTAHASRQTAVIQTTSFPSKTKPPSILTWRTLWRTTVNASDACLDDVPRQSTNGPSAHSRRPGSSRALTCSGKRRCIRHGRT